MSLTLLAPVDHELVIAKRPVFGSGSVVQWPCRGASTRFNFKQAQMAETRILRVSHENWDQFVMAFPKFGQGQGELIWAVAETGAATQG